MGLGKVCGFETAAMAMYFLISFRPVYPSTRLVTCVYGLDASVPVAALAARTR